MNYETVKLRARDRVRLDKQRRPMEDRVRLVRRMAVGSDFPFERALREGSLSLLCAIEGEGTPDELLRMARLCEEKGAAAVALSADSDLILQPDEGLRKITAAVGCPILRRDTVVDAYQIYEAKLLGASAVLLIAALHTAEELFVHIETAHQIGLSALVAVQDEREIGTALEAGARVIGVMRPEPEESGEDGLARSIRLREYVPDRVLFVADGGSGAPETLATLREIGADAAWIALPIR